MTKVRSFFIFAERRVAARRRSVMAQNLMKERKEEKRRGEMKENGIWKGGKNRARKKLRKIQFSHFPKPTFVVPVVASSKIRALAIFC